MLAAKFSLAVLIDLVAFLCCLRHARGKRRWRALLPYATGVIACVWRGVRESPPPGPQKTPPLGSIAGAPRGTQTPKNGVSLTPGVRVRAPQDLAKGFPKRTKTTGPQLCKKRGPVRAEENLMAISSLQNLPMLPPSGGSLPARTKRQGSVRAEESLVTICSLQSQPTLAPSGGLPPETT